MTFSLLLGSKSPRRKEILSYFDLVFEQASSDFDEEAYPYMGDPVDYVCQLAQKKSEALLPKFPDQIILTADTVVYHDGKIYGKPKTEEEACRMLQELTGRWHSVFTGVNITKGDQSYQGYEDTRVLFNEMTPAQIRHYHKKSHWADKAGGYAIQMAGGLLVKRIEGCYYNVMGLPINTVRELLLKMGIELWDYLK